MAFGTATCSVMMGPNPHNGPDPAVLTQAPLLTFPGVESGGSEGRERLPPSAPPVPPPPGADENVFSDLALVISGPSLVTHRSPAPATLFQGTCWRGWGARNLIQKIYIASKCHRVFYYRPAESVQQRVPVGNRQVRHTVERISFTPNV